MKANPSTRRTSKRGYLHEPPTSEQFERVTLGLHTDRVGDRLTVRVVVRLNGANAEPLRRLVVDALEEGVVAVDLDLGACDYADRSGLMALAQIRGRCAQRNVPLRIVAISPSVYTLLRFTGAMHKLFTFADGAIGEPFPETPHSLESHA